MSCRRDTRQKARRASQAKPQAKRKARSDFLPSHPLSAAVMRNSKHCRIHAWHSRREQGEALSPWAKWLLHSCHTRLLLSCIAAIHESWRCGRKHDLAPTSMQFWSKTHCGESCTSSAGYALKCAWQCMMQAECRVCVAVHNCMCCCVVMYFVSLAP